MAEVATPLIRRHWVIGAQVAVAALLFMAITQMSQTVLTRGLALLGLRTDIAAIVAVRACDEEVAVAPAAWAEGAADSRFEICRSATGDSQWATVVATVPGGQDVFAIVNGGIAETIRTSAARVSFDVQLRPGENVIALATGREAAARLQFSSRYARSRADPSFVEPPVTLIVPRGETVRRVVGSLESPQGRWLLVSGEPDTFVPDPSASGGFLIGPSGFATIPVDAVPPGVTPLDPARFRRSAVLSRQPDGSLRMTGEACLPTDSVLARWAVNGSLSANDFLTRLTQLEFEVIPRGSVLSADRISTTTTATCQLIRAQMAVPFAVVERSNGNFLTTPFDTLRLTGFGERLQYSEPPAARDDPGSLTFRGSPAADEATLAIEPDYARLNAELSDAGEPPAQARPAASRLAEAWNRAERGLPSWLRALLFGIAAVTPILLLLIAIRSGTGTGATDERRSALYTLYVLMVLAVVAAAQPFLFQIFYRASDLLGIWEVLVERRGSGRLSYPDPYAPVALASALMLLPLLNALKNEDVRPHSFPRAAAYLFFTLVAVILLAAAALLQILPWDESRELWLVGLLAGSGVRIAAEATLPLMIATLVVAACSAWIPIMWAFRAMMPRRGYFGPSFIAGLLAVLLPCVSYFVEAARASLLPPATSYSPGPSLLSLVAASVLPFTLFLVLLLAFRRILETAAPHLLQTEAGLQTRAGQLTRPRYLLLLAVVLTVPRLALSRVPVSPADMGIIEILAIFQSFSLVVAFITAAALLSRRPLIARGDLSAEVKPFLFKSDDVRILTALFAGFLALWATGALAIALAAGVGWFAFGKLVLDPSEEIPAERASNGLAAALVQHRHDCSLLDARRKEYESRYSKGTIEFAALAGEREKVEEVRAEQQADLATTPAEAKRRLLEFGPEPTPSANGLRGALAGLAFAVLLQLASSISQPDAGETVQSWADLARMALVDPAYAIAPTGPTQRPFVPPPAEAAATPDLLLFVGALINASFLWIVIGFVFGFAFHRIRGDDGMVKGLVFAAGVAVTYGFSQLFSASTQGIQPFRIVPVVLFLLLLGVVIFDAASLSRRRQSPLRLVEVYGFRTSLGYMSVIGGIAALDPILAFFRGLMGRG